ncbi:MAG TPA: UDP-N-acetylmuramoyl-tripeptide--D-alanyl-D-alanine ligase [Arthrobacter sp.]|nr:UDP-N-acetylmuramoyl-tripeptide--D-alanyl-D-alanine ligase [Arthrobacter sp.]
MIELSAEEIAAITGGRLTGAARPDLTVESVATDSREVAAGAMFVAKPGEFADGHTFIGKAFDAGAVLALAERPVSGTTGSEYPAVIVEDAVLAMGALAAAIVRRLRASGELTVIGITGSAGKTTTKDLLSAVLSAKAPTVAPIGSYNGEVGVPLTVFEADFSTRYLIIEMGATGIGHIEYLASMVRPDIGVVLGVGSAHAGEFGSIENIAIAKGELVEALSAEGTAVLNADDARVIAMRDRTVARVLSFSSDPDLHHAGLVKANEPETTPEGHPAFDLSFPDGTGGHVASGLLGSHHIGNLLAAAAAAYAAGIGGTAVAAALSGQAPGSRWRMERTERADGVTVINDAYNANPESMRAALRTLAELGRGRRTWAVLGEMLELGDESVEQHDAVGRIVVRLNISRLVAVGAGAKAIHNAAVLEGSWGDEAVFADNLDAAEELLRAELEPGDLVLFKSSNGAGLRLLGDRIAASAAEGKPLS